MAVNYTRVGWQDAPSTDTPIDAANLNHMDNGILALSEEVDTELPLLRDQINDVSADIETQIDEKISPEVSSWLGEHVDPVGSAVVVDDTLTIQGAAADAKKTGDEISDLKDDLFDNSPLLVDVPFSDITEKANYFLIGGNETSSSLWRIMTLSVSPGEKYQITARYYSSIECVSFFDAENAFILETGSSATDEPHTIDVTVPANAVTMRINDKKSSSFSVKKYKNILNNDLIYVNGQSIDTIVDGLEQYIIKIGSETQPGSWEIGSKKFVNKVLLHGSANSTFNYSNIFYNGIQFKDTLDDISPVSVAYINYIGANHGYNFAYTCTLSSHGLTASDIGKTCVINGETWILAQVNTTAKFTVFCLDDSKWCGVKRVTTPPTTFDFGVSITVTKTELSQFYPSVKNIDVSVVESSSNHFIVKESYDIIDLKTGLATIATNIGNNDNNSVTELSDVIMTVRNLYDFGNNGECAVTENLKITNTELSVNAYHGTQSTRFSTSDYFAVPMTSYAIPSAYGTEINFTKSTWDDNNTPPLLYIQMDNKGNDATRMFVQAIIMDNRIACIDNNAGFIYTTGKMYPYAVSPSSSVSDPTTYNFTAIRIPMYAYDNDDDVKFVGYCKVGQDYYLMCYNNSTISKTISVPLEMLGKNIETIVTHNCECLNSIVSTGIDLSITGEGYCFLKLS